MDNLIKTIKKLSEQEYRELVEEVSPNKNSKPYQVLELARNNDLNDSQMMEALQVNASTYYTLKSRLNSKVATALNKKVENPISVLLEEVMRVPAALYGTNKGVSVRALRELEKQLLEYDLTNELIIVYKTLARLKMYSPDYESLMKTHDRYVAFNLASSNAESLFYDFIRLAGVYLLSGEKADAENMADKIRQINNIGELYESHRINVYFSLARLYFLLTTIHSREALQNKEMEIDTALQEMRATFEKYPLDTFYSNLKFIVDCLYVEYYSMVGNLARSRHYYTSANEQIPNIAQQHIQAFHVIQFLEAKVRLYKLTSDLSFLTDGLSQLEENLEIDADEFYHYVAYQRYLAIVAYYQGNYQSAARIINKLRNSVNTKSVPILDIELKLFQGLNYVLLGEFDLSTQLCNSIGRTLKDPNEETERVKAAVKFLKYAMREFDRSKKLKKLESLWQTATEKPEDGKALFQFLKLEPQVMDKLSGSTLAAGYDRY